MRYNTEAQPLKPELGVKVMTLPERVAVPPMVRRIGLVAVRLRVVPSGSESLLTTFLDLGVGNMVVSKSTRMWGARLGIAVQPETVVYVTRSKGSFAPRSLASKRARTFLLYAIGLSNNKPRLPEGVFTQLCTRDCKEELFFQPLLVPVPKVPCTVLLKSPPAVAQAFAFRLFQVTLLLPLSTNTPEPLIAWMLTV